MKRWIGILLFFIILCMGKIHVRAAEIQTETQIETQTELNENLEEENNAGKSGSYNSKKMFGIEEEFDVLSGSLKHLGSKYRNNYHLDLEKTGLSDIINSAANAIANTFFLFFQIFAMGVCTIVYYCLDFSLADTIAKFITALQTGLINGVFKQLWLLPVVVMGFSMIGKLAKKAFVDIIKDLGMVVLVMILSVLLISKTDFILTATTNLTKSVANSIFTGLDTITGTSSDGSYAANAAGALWLDMIHEPWLTLEFGSFEPDDEVVDEILSLHKDSADRKDIIKDITKETGCFNKTRGWERLGILVLYLIPLVLKGVVFIFISLMQILGQVLAVFVMLLPTFVLLLAIIPNYGIGIIKSWIQKFFDIHLSMVILSFLMAFMIWINKILYTFVGTFGWFISMLFQAGICIGLILNYKTIILILLNPKNAGNEVERLMRRNLLRRGRNGNNGGYGGAGGAGNYEDYYNDYENPDDYYEDYGEEFYDYEDYSGESSRYANASYEKEKPNIRYTSGENNEYRGNIQNDNLETNRRYEQPIEDGNLPMYKTDYQSINNAPSQQELHDLFNHQSEELDYKNNLEKEIEGEKIENEKSKEKPLEHIALKLESENKLGENESILDEDRTYDNCYKENEMDMQENESFKEQNNYEKPEKYDIEEGGNSKDLDDEHSYREKVVEKENVSDSNELVNTNTINKEQDRSNEMTNNIPLQNVQNPTEQVVELNIRINDDEIKQTINSQASSLSEEIIYKDNSGKMDSSVGTTVKEYFVDRAESEVIDYEMEKGDKD